MLTTNGVPGFRGSGVPFVLSLSKDANGREYERVSGIPFVPVSGTGQV